MSDKMPSTMMDKEKPLTNWQKYGKKSAAKLKKENPEKFAQDERKRQKRRMDKLRRLAAMNPATAILESNKLVSKQLLQSAKHDQKMNLKLAAKNQKIAAKTLESTGAKVRKEVTSHIHKQTKLLIATTDAGGSKNNTNTGGAGGTKITFPVTYMVKEHKFDQFNHFDLSSTGNRIPQQLLEQYTDLDKSDGLGPLIKQLQERRVHKRFLGDLRTLFQGRTRCQHKKWEFTIENPEAFRAALGRVMHYIAPNFKLVHWNAEAEKLRQELAALRQKNSELAQTITSLEGQVVFLNEKLSGKKRGRTEDDENDEYGVYAEDENGYDDYDYDNSDAMDYGDVDSCVEPEAKRARHE